MTDDREAIWAAIQASRRIERLYSGTILTRAASFEADLRLIYAELFHPDAALLRTMRSPRRRVRRIRAIRLVLEAVGRIGFEMLRFAAQGVSNSPYVLILRERQRSELPDGGRAIRKIEREWRDASIAERTYNLMDQHGLSQDVAIDQTLREQGQNLSIGTVKQIFKVLRKTAAERGFVSPVAAELGRLTGISHPDQIKPALNAERLRRRGRRKKVDIS